MTYGISMFTSRLKEKQFLPGSICPSRRGGAAGVGSSPGAGCPCGDFGRYSQFGCGCHHIPVPLCFIEK